MIIHTFISDVIVGLLLFLPAGTWRWPAAWVFLAGMNVFWIGYGSWLAHHDPALFAERFHYQPPQKTWDKVFMASLYLLLTSWLMLMALDAVRFRWSYVPLGVQAIGGMLIVTYVYITHLAFRENPYAAPVVKVQTERGHQVVSTGVYAYVRHPMYAGAVFLVVGTPLLLGSWYGLVIASFIVALLAARAMLEERTLASELPGYRDYATRVRYRFMPGIW